MIEKDSLLNFEEYLRASEPHKQVRAYNWRTAIGLQAVDGLHVSDYLKQTAKRNIEGEITIDEAQELIKSYYQSKTNREPDDDEKQEADKVSANISRILSRQTLDFTANGFVALHRRIFDGVFKHAGQVRKYDITKKEWVLRGDTVNYLNYEDLWRALDYDINQEKNFSYKGLSGDEVIAHIVKFVSGLWQIHPFGEGNTRTTAVFVIQYLRSIGFDVNNDLFAENSWYFRNALVRANYKNAVKGIEYTPVYLERFFRNLLLGEQHELRNRYLLINLSPEEIATPTSTRQAPDKYPTSTRQVPYNPNIAKLVSILGNNQLSVKELLQAFGLKDRENFLRLFLNPAIEEGFVKLLYPDKPRHPRQKYLLTVKGLTLYNEFGKN
ncbi:MAG: Fic family protein [Prevotella sp.]|nr:Fic family protein [Prevotella sp.]